MHSDKPCHLIPSYTDCRSRKQALHFGLTAWSHEYECRHCLFISSKNETWLISVFFFFHLVHEWKVIYLLILVMMQNGPDVYMRLYVSCFVNMRLFFCNKSGLNINHSGLILPLWTKQRFCFSATVFQNQVLVSVSVVGNKKRARKKTEL